MKPTDEAKRLRDEIIKEWFKDMKGKSFETRMSAAINKVLDAVISVAESERLTEETGDPSDTAYESAIDCVTLAINKLRP